MKWARIVVASISVPITVLVLIMLVVTAYAFKLAFEAKGQPDQVRIQEFAQHVGRSSWAILVILVTVPPAAWAVRKLEGGHQRNGALVGLLVAVAGLAMSSTPNVLAIGEFALTIGAGWFAGAIVAHRRAGT
jgi:hypothetical protein